MTRPYTHRLSVLATALMAVLMLGVLPAAAAAATAPIIADVRIEQNTPDGHLPIDVVVGVDESPVTKVRFKTGAYWSPAYPFPQDQNVGSFDWDALDPAAGGSPFLGSRTVHVQVQNQAGLWSLPVSRETFLGFEDSSISVSGDLRTGHAVTFTPDLPEGAEFPAGSLCWWGLFWGNDQSLYYGNRDETFGGIEFSGTQEDGFCDPWTVTLPWVPFRQFMVHFSAESEHSMMDTYLGGSPDAADSVEPGVDSLSRHITTSSLPLVYVLPDSYELTVGVPVTYRAFAIAGETIRSSDRWQVNYPNVPEVKYGGSTFTFTPKMAGYLTVCWMGETREHFLSACFDPPARYPDSTRPNTTAPAHQFTTGTASTTVPVKVTWSGTDKGWGVKWYRLERSVNGGAWAKVALQTGTTKSIAQALTPGSAYRYRVRATDGAGNVGTWDYGRTFTAARVGDTSSLVQYSNDWSVVADSTALGGSLHESVSVGAASSFTFTGTDVAWLSEIGPGHGQAKFYVDGVYQKTVDLLAATPSPRKLIFIKHFATTGTHTLRVLVVGTSGRPLVSHDGYAILR